MAKLVLVRHGQSQWNLENRFTGWVDVPLSKKGIEEAISAGKKLKDFEFDKMYVSHMLRAIQTLNYILFESNSDKTLIFKHENERVSKWELNYTGNPKKEIHVYQSVDLAERYYGDLQGLNKQKTREKYGDKQVHLWRRSYDTNPPNGESLKDTCERTTPYYEKYIVNDLQEGKTVLVSAHGNSLRAITMFVEKISEKEIPSVEIPTGIPIVYTFDENMNMVDKKLL
ncbi:MAG: 2,3-bisphosphoglycerate-dependent phosphoglycerate mutase [Thermoplasmatales archaeon]|nr:2,3-bisphosphoglycerate-dependent phosphoglycerate mutase [Thermoplasmatales archaeon]MCK4996121.1 2,3-bisphosphoglycerate-dependent phosphoglycerate mutase [Thermoplasmatales archaeon]